MGKIFVLIDVGCHECGVNSEYVKSFSTKEEAEKEKEELAIRTDCWRDGGQSIPQVFEVDSIN